MTPAFTELDISSVEWGWSFWLIVFLPAAIAFFVGMFSGAKSRSIRVQLTLFFGPLLCLSLLTFCLWTLHAERIDQAKIDYFIKHENPSTFSWSGPPSEEPVYNDWSTPGNKGFYINIRDDDGSLYCRPPKWVLPAAFVYCTIFWSIGFLLLFTRRNKAGDSAY